MYKMYIKTIFLTLFCAFLSITNAHSVKKPTINNNSAATNNTSYSTNQSQQLPLISEHMINLDPTRNQRIAALRDEARRYSPESITRTISLQELRPITPARD